jgi:hypothetical protein
VPRGLAPLMYSMPKKLLHPVEAVQDDRGSAVCCSASPAHVSASLCDAGVLLAHLARLAAIARWVSLWRSRPLPGLRKTCKTCSSASRDSRSCSVGRGVYRGLTLLSVRVGAQGQASTGLPSVTALQLHQQSTSSTPQLTGSHRTWARASQAGPWGPARGAGAPQRRCLESPSRRRR